MLEDAFVITCRLFKGQIETQQLAPILCYFVVDTNMIVSTLCQWVVVDQISQDALCIYNTVPRYMYFLGPNGQRMPATRIYGTESYWVSLSPH